MKELDPAAVMYTAEYNLLNPGAERLVKVKLDWEMLMLCAFNTWRYMEVYRENKPLLPGDEEDREFMLHEENPFRLMEINLIGATTRMASHKKQFEEVQLNGYDMAHLKFVIGRGYQVDDYEYIDEYHSRLKKKEASLFYKVMSEFQKAGGVFPKEDAEPPREDPLAA